MNKPIQFDLTLWETGEYRVVMGEEEQRPVDGVDIDPHQIYAIYGFCDDHEELWTIEGHYHLLHKETPSFNLYLLPL